MRGLRKFLRWAVSGSFTLLLSACYGAPIAYQEEEALSLKACNLNSEPIPDLEVAVYRGSDWKYCQGSSVHLWKKGSENIAFCYQHDISLKNREG